jgi:squalene-hopene/tetraprenyl-beta-curcumene cyclase
MTIRQSSSMHLERAVDWLLDRQRSDGSWYAEFETDIAPTAEYIFLYKCLGADLNRLRPSLLRHLLSQQRDDGSWTAYFDGPGDLNLTVLGYVALRALGLEPTRGPAIRAREVIGRLGGVEATPYYGKFWLALLGLYPWSRLIPIPLELFYLPSVVPGSVRSLQILLRMDLVARLLLVSRRAVFDVGLASDELNSIGLAGSSPSELEPAWCKALRAYDSLPWHPGRRATRRQMTSWLLERQGPDGSWGGFTAPTTMSILALRSEGLPASHPAVGKGLKALDHYLVSDDARTRLQFTASSVCDTPWAILALLEAGLAPSEPRIKRSVCWLLDQRVGIRANSTTSQLAGWPFQPGRDGVPDLDTTSFVVRALLRALPAGEAQAATTASIAWALATASRNGGWNTYGGSASTRLPLQLPGMPDLQTLSGPDEDVTAHVLEMLADAGFATGHATIDRCVSFLLRKQGSEGSWNAHWGVNHVYGSWCALSCLNALRTAGSAIGSAANWIRARQNADHGWGESCQSYADPAWIGRGPSTAPQTAWAVMALHAAGLATDRSSLNGIDYLERTQRDGTWEVAQHTAVVLPGLVYAKYHLLCHHVFPTLALAGVVSGRGRR